MYTNIQVFNYGGCKIIWMIIHQFRQLQQP